MEMFIDKIGKILSFAKIGRILSFAKAFFFFIKIAINFKKQLNLAKGK